MINYFRNFVFVILFLFTGIIFYNCEMSLEPSEIEVKENPIELKWIKNDINTSWCWYITECKELFNKGTECDQILLYLSNRYFTYSVNDIVYLILMEDTGKWQTWHWCEK